jgi:hypothetical protein
MICRGADLAALVREASVIALKEYISQANAIQQQVCVMNKHFQIAFTKVKPSVSTKVLFFSTKFYFRYKELEILSSCANSFYSVLNNKKIFLFFFFMPTPLKVGGHIVFAYSGIQIYYLFPSGL